MAAGGLAGVAGVELPAEAVDEAGFETDALASGLFFLLVWLEVPESPWL